MPYAQPPAGAETSQSCLATRRPVTKAHTRYRYAKTAHPLKPRSKVAASDSVFDLTD